jgi:hypothetical protein
MGHPAAMKAICAGKKKSDKLDARMLADLLRANLFPACFVISPKLEGLRRQMRFRRLVMEEAVRFKNKTAGLLMETGIEYERRRLHGKRYFAELMRTHDPALDEDLRPLLDSAARRPKSWRAWMNGCCACWANMGTWRRG